jgi:hypothetical protein
MEDDADQSRSQGIRTALDHRKPPFKPRPRALDCRRRRDRVMPVNATSTAVPGPRAAQPAVSQSPALRQHPDARWLPAHGLRPSCGG